VHLVGFHYKNLVDNLPVFLSFLFRPLHLQPTHFRCRRLLLHLVTLRHTHTHTRARARLNSAGRVIGLPRNLYLYNSQLPQETDTRSPGGIRNPQSLPTSSCSLTLYTARPPTSAWTVVEGVPTAVLETVNDSCGRKWLVSVTLRPKRRLCGHTACAGLHVKCASCLSDCSHRRTVGRYQLNLAVSAITRCL
jgi:hypothetical protein